MKKELILSNNGRANLQKNSISNVPPPRLLVNNKFITNGDNAEQLKTRYDRIIESQAAYTDLFNKLNTVIDMLQVKYTLPEFETVFRSSAAPSPELKAAVHSQKRKVSSDDSGSIEVDIVEALKRSRPSKRRRNLIEQQQLNVTDLEYPQLIENSRPLRVMIGPNGTTVLAKDFYQIVWCSAAVSTRTLLGFIFDNDVLATHTLTGKPSPAFYGRERPTKMQLDPKKTQDIIHCVRIKCGGSERDVRAAITTKCADTAKKYKRRSLLQNRG